MQHVFAGLFDFVFTPSSFLLLLCVAGLLLTLRRRPVWGNRLLAVGIGGFFLFAVVPIGTWLLRPLENRFPPPAALPDHVDGIISLGGAIDPGLTASRGRPSLRDTGARMTDFVALARRYPRARLVFAGGYGEIFAARVSEAAVARVFYGELGIDPRRVVYEDKSRNTHENAAFALKLVHPRAGERWLLVTTAADMPRAVGSFRAVGWRVTAVPADYHTYKRGARWPPGLLGGLRNADMAFHEWTGLVYYRLRGWTPSLFPGPE